MRPWTVRPPSWSLSRAAHSSHLRRTAPRRHCSAFAKRGLPGEAGGLPPAARASHRKLQSERPAVALQGRDVHPLHRSRQLDGSQIGSLRRSRIIGPKHRNQFQLEL